MTVCCRPRCGAEQLEDENGKLRKVVADPSLDEEMLQDAPRRKL
jgi:putative transposase